MILVHLKRKRWKIDKFLKMNILNTEVYTSEVLFVKWPCILKHYLFTNILFAFLT